MDNLLEILASPKQVGLLIGAGVSIACGLPGVDDLSIIVREKVKGSNFEKILDASDNVEVILNKIQQLKSLIGSKTTINGITLENIITIEKDVKETILTKLSEEVGFDKLCNLFIWLNYINRENEKEIFTLNYDLLIERALENVDLPYFSGFIGNVRPFFISDSVDDFTGLFIKHDWTKLWKLHGSLNFKKSCENKIYIENNINDEFENLLVYPSMEKYLSSRKAPFISYLDRFRRYLQNGEKILIILGYSFNDEHINEIIINGLNSNSLLTILSFAYDDNTYNEGIKIFGMYPNFSVYTENKKYINRNENPFTYKKNIGDFGNFIELIDSLLMQSNDLKQKEELKK